MRSPTNAAAFAAALV